MDLFRAAMQNIPKTSRSKEEILREKLYHCTYGDEYPHIT